LVSRKIDGTNPGIPGIILDLVRHD